MNEANKLAYRQEHQRKWIALLEKLFPDGIAEQASWRDRTEIVSILQAIIEFCCSSHYLYTPEEGSVELRRVRASLLGEGIELSYSDTAVVYPVELVFYGFKGYPLWSYFRIITAASEPIGVQSQDQFNPKAPVFSEFAYRTPVMQYSGSKTDDGRGTKVVQGSQELIKNYYKGGDFVLFSSVSPFGKLWDQDWGLHQRLGDKGFRVYIQELVNREKGEQN